MKKQLQALAVWRAGCTPSKRRIMAYPPHPIGGRLREAFEESPLPQTAASGAAAVLAPLELAHACICERRGRQSESESESQRNREREREGERCLFPPAPVPQMALRLCAGAVFVRFSHTPPPTLLQSRSSCQGFRV